MEKLYFSIREVAEMLGVSQSLLRFWETEFDCIKPHKNKKDAPMGVLRGRIGCFRHPPRVSQQSITGKYSGSGRPDAPCLLGLDQ
jgi:hypothetical protein